MTENPLRYSEITPELHAGLRILAALEVCYPQTGDRCTRTLKGFEDWRKRKWKASQTAQGAATGP